ITINVDEDHQVKSNEAARIQSSLIGDAVINFSPTGPAEGARTVEPGGPPLRGYYTPSPLDMMSNLQGDMQQALLSLSRAGDEVAELSNRLNTVLGDADSEKLRNVIESADSALANFGQVMADLDDIL